MRACVMDFLFDPALKVVTRRSFYVALPLILRRRSDPSPSVVTQERKAARHAVYTFPPMASPLPAATFQGYVVEGQGHQSTRISDTNSFIAPIALPSLARFVYNILLRSVVQGGAVVKRVRHLGLRSVGREFESCSRQRCVTTLGKLFTPTCLCHQAV